MKLGRFVLLIIIYAITLVRLDDWYNQGIPVNDKVDILDVLVLIVLIFTINYIIPLLIKNWNKKIF